MFPETTIFFLGLEMITPALMLLAHSIFCMLGCMVELARIPRRPAGRRRRKWFQGFNRRCLWPPLVDINKISLLSSAWHEVESNSLQERWGIGYVSSAYFMSLPSVIGRRSPTLINYKASPIADLCITLAKISMISQRSPLNLVQWERLSKKSNPIEDFIWQW